MKTIFDPPWTARAAIGAAFGTGADLLPPLEHGGSRPCFGLSGWNGEKPSLCRQELSERGSDKARISFGGPIMSSHDEMNSLLPEYLSGGLTADQRKAIEISSGSM